MVKKLLLFGFLAIFIPFLWGSPAIAGLPLGNRVKDPYAILRNALPVNQKELRELQHSLEDTSDDLKGNRWTAVSKAASRSNFIVSNWYICDGIFIDAKNCTSDQNLNSLSFGILQATRTRISKTEYISCPSCGRTLFDLQETTAKIRKVTDHLKGVKIGIMGCIVNGPGEMADADYGYVGTRAGKITLYKEKEIVEKNIDENLAVDALINLIKKHGDWVEKKI